MKGKNGNLIIAMKEGNTIALDGPGQILVKKVKGSRVIVLVNANDETNIRRGAKEKVGKTKDVTDKVNVEGGPSGMTRPRK